MLAITQAEYDALVAKFESDSEQERTSADR
jgi:hypothetical protein